MLGDMDSGAESSDHRGQTAESMPTQKTITAAVTETAVASGHRIAPTTQIAIRDGIGSNCNTGNNRHSDGCRSGDEQIVVPSGASHDIMTVGCCERESDSSGNRPAVLNL